jgi:hypothetical protein
MGNNLQLRFWPLIPRLAPDDRSIPLVIEVSGIGPSPDLCSFALRIDRLGHELITEHWEKDLTTTETTDIFRFEHISSQLRRKFNSNKNGNRPGDTNRKVWVPV